MRRTLLAFLLVLLPPLVAAVAVSAGIVVAPSPARATGLELIKAKAVSEFPDGIRFLFEARSDKPVDEVIVRFAVAGQPTTQYNYLKTTNTMDAGGAIETVSGEYFHRTGQRDRYVPPGVEFTYFFEVLYKDGTSETTKPETLVAHDSRFRWESFSQGPVTVFYHGPVQKRAEFVADVTLATLENMGPITGADVKKALRIVMYNNDAEMIGAVSIRSLTSARQLITEGQAFSQHNLVIVQAGADRAAGVISHEVTHILVGRAADRAVAGVPVWLNEGLAEYGNLDPGLSYVRFLEWAVDTNRLVPIVYLDNFPADPNLTIVAYGEARSILEFMINKWGREKVASLLAEYNGGTPFAEAMKKVYGFDLQELDRQWRLSLGAKPYEPATQSALPTREPQVQLTPFTIEATPAGTAAPAGTATPVSGAAATPAAQPTAQAPQAQATQGASGEGTQSAPATQATATPTPTGGGSGGGGCSARLPGAPGGPIEASALLLLLAPPGLFGLRYIRLRMRH